MKHMLSLAEAQARVIAMAPSLPEIHISTPTAIGHFVSRDIIALRTQPPADLSAMDGYAICGSGSWELVGESRAGHPFHAELKSGQCIRISTGAVMPTGATSVLIQENAEVEDTIVRCTSEAPDDGQHIRRRGFDFIEGDEVLPAGSRIGPTQIALAIAAGHAELPVRQPPKVAVIDSGDELSADPTHCRDDQIPASNGAMISAMLSAEGCEVTRLGPVPDSLEALTDALVKCEDADVIITSGGASVGDHDLVGPAISEWGATIEFWKVAIKPGKPLMIARKARQVILGLPGNPVSSFVTAFLFALPLIRSALGSDRPLPQLVKLPCCSDLPRGGSRHEFLRAHWNGQTLKPVDSTDSSALVALASSNCLIDRPIEAPAVIRGTVVDAYLLGNGAIA